MQELGPRAPSCDRPSPIISADESRRESRHILDRVARDSDMLGASALARAARDTVRQLAGREDHEADRVEIWAKRIGRSLGVLFAVYLVAQLMRHVAGL